jgi:hypothetical protein
MGAQSKGAEQMREETKKAAGELREWFSRRGFDRGETKLAAKRILDLISAKHSGQELVTHHVTMIFDLNQAKLCGVHIRDSLYFSDLFFLKLACAEIIKTYKLCAVRVGDRESARAAVIAEYDNVDHALSAARELRAEACTNPFDDFMRRADPFFEARDRFTGYYVLDPDGERVALDTADTPGQADR